MNVAEGEAAATVPQRGTSGPSPLANRRRRWPIWSEPQSTTMCSICGWTGEHSSVCPFGPEPSRSKERR